MVINYALTMPDVMILCFVGLMAIALIMAWPHKNEHIHSRERSFVLGRNAARISWNSRTGKHVMRVMLTRKFDMPPHVNDIVFFVEKGGDMARYKVIDITILGSWKHITLTVIPMSGQQ